MCSHVKLEIGIWFDGRHHDLWCYDTVPAGMRPAPLRDLWPGRQVLYQVQLGPDAGKYYTGFCIPGRGEILREMVNRGHHVYVKD